MDLNNFFFEAFQVVFSCFASIETDKIPYSTACAFLGVEQELTHKISIPYIPTRCKAVFFGNYYFDTPPIPANTEMISSLVKASIPVYTFVAGNNKLPPWLEMMTTNKHDDQIKSMVTYMKDSKISGIVLDFFDSIFDENITDHATKVNALVSKIKGYAPSLKVGMMIQGWQCDEYGRKDLFDFDATNCMMDLYFIDTTNTGLTCDSTAAKIGMLPVKLDADSPYVSLDDVCQGVAESNMDRSKVFLFLRMRVGLVVNGKRRPSLEYPQYCKLTKNNKTDPKALYCAGTHKMYRDQAKHARPHFAGIVFGELDYDDYNNECGHGKYSYTKAGFDGWESGEPQLMMGFKQGQLPQDGQFYGV